MPVDLPKGVPDYRDLRLLLPYYLPNMPPADATTTEPSPPSDTDEAAGLHAANETRNLLFLALQQIVIRVGWIFKTESVIMPAFVDMIAGQRGWVRGCLPALNRLGQSIPQFLFADKLRSMPLKRRSLAWSAIFMGVPFLVLSGLLSLPGAVGTIWLPVLFLVLYLFFFSMTGLYQLSMGTITGKLISPTRRGSLIAAAGVIGVTCAATAAWNFLPAWLALENAATGAESEIQTEGSGFRRIFLFVGSAFVLAGGTVLFIKEAPDTFVAKKRAAPFGDAWRRVRADKHLARLLVVSTLFVSSLLLVPHYQTLARGGRLDFSSLMIWVVIQNISAGVMALVSGTLANRFGFRLSIRLLLFLSGCCPLIAIGLKTWADPSWFILAFICFGAIPNTFRALESYCLELTEPSRHAQYISTLKLFMPITLLFAPLVGLLIDRVGFGPVFVTVGLINMVAVGVTFFIEEPRQWSG